MSELKFSPGKAVEVSLHGEDSLDTWYPASVIKETGKGSFLVEYKRTDEGGPVQVIVDSLHIRPSPPACANTTFQLLEKVDAFCNFGWSSGVVTKVLAEGRYIVYFKRTRKEKELRHTDLRLPMVQIHGKWTHPSQDAAADVISNSHESKDNNLGDNGKIGTLPVISGIVKDTEEEVRNGPKEQARIVSSTAIEGETRSKALHDRAPRKKPRRDKTFKELNAEPAPEELQSPHQVCETQMVETEKVDPGIVKETEDVRNDQKEQDITVSSTGIEGDNKSLHDRTTKKKPRRDRTVKELNTEASPKELETLLHACETQMTVTDQLDQKEIMEVPTSDKVNTSLEPSENGKEDKAKSATPGRSLEVSEEKLDPPTKRRSVVRGKGRRGRGRLSRRGRPRPQESVPSNPTASDAGGAANQLPIAFAESFQGYFEKPIVISLPCYKSQLNKLPAQGTAKLPIQDATEGQEEEKLLPAPVSDGSTVNTENHGKPETKGLNNENSTTPKRKRGRPFGSLSGQVNENSTIPKRKRGRPFGSLSAPGKRKVKETDEVSVTIVSTKSSSQRRSTRERREVYKSAIDTLRPKTKKLRTLSEDSSPTQETEPNVNEKPEALVTNNLSEYVEPVSHGVDTNISDQDDEDRPLSTWFGEAHSLPNHTKPISGGNTSQSGKLAARNDLMPTVPHKEETTGGSDVDLAQSASQDEGATVREREGEKATDIVLKGLPFSKVSPIWKVIESMEVFQQIPQNPHFQPLYDTKEHCREGLAICSMVTFSRLAEDISKFRFDDPNNILEDSMETLSDLERQGFSVESIRSRLIALLSIKSGHGHAQIIEKKISEEDKEIAKIDEEIDGLDRKIAELREKRESHALEREKKNAKIGELQLVFDPLKKTMEAARSEFERLVNAPW